MALTLDATLAAAQDNAYRYPLSEIISAQRTADIPFDGTMLTSETFNEYGVNLIAHSAGRLVLAYIYYNPTGSVSGIKFVYTDTARTAFTTVDLPLYSYGVNEIKAVSICEMTGGNIGMVLLVNDKANHLYRVTRRIYTPLGVAVSDAEIANWSHDIYTSDPWVQTLGANSYVVVYAKISGSDYSFYKRTSSDFLTWSAEGALSIGGLTSTWRLANPSLIKTSTGDLWLWFDALESTGPGGEELTNIYYSVSADGGGTWGAAVKVTAYDTYSEIGRHPVAVQKAANQMNLIYTRQVGALHMKDDAAGWPTGNASCEFSWDSVNRMFYVVNINNQPGTKSLQNVTKIDIDTWQVVQYWDATTSPGFPSWITDGSHHLWFLNHSHEGHIIALFSVDHRLGWVLDGEADTITNYYFDTHAELSVTKNVTHSGLDAGAGYAFAESSVDLVNNRIWMLFVQTYVWSPGFIVGYLDLAETTDYQFHTVLTYTDASDTEVVGAFGQAYGGMKVDTSGGYIVITSGHATYWTGACWVFDIDTGGLIVRWQGSVDGDFPYYGLSKPFVYNGRIYAGMATYTSGHGQSSFRGLAEIDIAGETITLHRPTYCSDDDHYFGPPGLLEDGKIAMVHWGKGLAVFDTIGKTWELFNNARIPGMTLDGLDMEAPAQVIYDTVNDLIIVGDPGSWASRAGYGIIMFSIHGFMRQSYYSIGTDPGAGWAFPAAAALVQGYLDYDAAAVVEPGSSTSMFVFWTNEDTVAEKSVKWDKDGSSLDLSAFLIAEREIEVVRSIDGKPAHLAFTVSHGHLFDPYNLSSLYSLYLKKGRKLTLRFGEKIGGTDYWQAQGTFFVTGTALSFKRGDYPVMEVEAEDARCLWVRGNIMATDIYNTLGENILADLMLDIANMGVAEIDFPSMGGSAFPMQWVDTSLEDIIQQICDRLGYFFRFDVDGKATARKISNVASIDHLYPDQTKIVRFSPDDRYSDFTNKVIVHGQELDFTQMLFDEERVGALNGTVGWWGFRKDYDVWYSDDKSRRCMSPRLVVIETTTTIAFKLSGDIDETLTEPDTALSDYKYCTITVTAPNLIPLLVASIGIVGASLLVGDITTWPGSPTIPLGKIMEKVGLIMALMILASVGNFQYEVWAQPIGRQRRSVQGEWNDEEHQVEIGCTVPQTLVDPLCYSAADCAAVAAFEGMVVQMQRRRVTIEKIAHLQDEEGDTIRVKHPYSGQNIDLFIASIRRIYKKASPGADDGHFLDEIEGWVVG